MKEEEEEEGGEETATPFELLRAGHHPTFDRHIDEAEGRVQLACITASLSFWRPGKPKQEAKVWGGFSFLLCFFLLSSPATMS